MERNEDLNFSVIQSDDKNPKQVKVISNRPRPEKMLTPVFLFEKILKNIFNHNNLKDSFEKTKKEFSELEVLVLKAKCSGCELNRRGKPLMSSFIEDFLKLSEDNKKVALGILGQKTMTSLDQSWLNLENNENIPFEYRMATIASPAMRRPLNDNSVVKNIIDKATVKNNILDKQAKKKIIFQNFQGPGDIVMMTAAIRDLFRKYEKEKVECPFIIDVKTSSMHIWEGNPYVEFSKGTPLDEKDPSVEVIKLSYPLIHQSNQGPYHFTEAFTEEIEDKLGVRIKSRLCKGDIHMRQEEDAWGWTERSTWFKDSKVDPNAPYWVIDAGHKNDFTAKFWGKSKFQSLVEHYKGKIQFVQIGHKAHIHPNLDGVINLIGKTDDRQLIRLIWASSGVVTPVSFPMVLAAAIPVKKGTCNNRLERPCVVIAGGREPSVWQAHTNHQFIHTCGSLPCCDRGGCWVSRTKPIGDGDEKDTRNLCHHVTIDDFGDEVPYCMHMISVDDVIRRIDMYYQFYEEDKKKYTYNKK